MENLIKQLCSTNSTKEKTSILMNYKNNEKIKEAFRLCYDPFIVSNIKKISIVQNKKNLNFEQAFDSFLFVFKSISTRKITGNDAYNAVESLLEICLPETQQIFINIIQKDMSCGVSHATIKKVWGNILQEFSVQLANKYDFNKDYGVKSWLISRKYDGIRLYYSNNMMLTRSGKSIVGFDHIQKELDDLCHQYKLDFIDGELFSKEIPFQTIQGYVLSYKNINEENKKKIKFHIFAVGRKDFNNTREMVHCLENIYYNKYKYITPVQYYSIENIQEVIEQQTFDFIEENYEGAMLRHPENWYSWDRSDNLLKVKFFKVIKLGQIE